MNVIKLDDLEDKTEFIDFCRAAAQDTGQPAAVNMWHVDWYNLNHTLPYVLFKNNRYSGVNGEFFLVLDQEKIVGCSGIYVSEFSKDIAIGGCRTWISKEYRNLSLPREYLLPAHKKWAIENKFKAIALTFNGYNKKIIETWKRNRLGEKRSPRQPHHIFYSNFNEVPFVVNIQHTGQWAIYEVLDQTFDFDWNSIRLDNCQDIA